jgi:hypothetical protein
MFTHTKEGNVTTRMPKGFQELPAENLQTI